jgi:5-methylcytosine-specific restriction endonuclease McrA
MPKDKRTYSDRAAYNIQAVTKRRRKLREMAKEYKGGKCMICGYSKYKGALDFHHLDPSKKNFGISVRGLTRSWDKIKAELDKCILVCANCHRELHAGILQLPKET